jgi:hypothetical protein
MTKSKRTVHISVGPPPPVSILGANKPRKKRKKAKAKPVPTRKKTTKSKFIDIKELAEHLKKRAAEYNRRTPLDFGPCPEPQPDEIAEQECLAIVQMLRMAWTGKGPVGKFVKEIK